MPRLSWVPNFLTILRMALIAPLLFFFESKETWVSVSIFGFVVLTDFLDGFLARRFGWTSLSGSILDPVADKMVSMSFFAFFAWKGDLFLPYFLLAFGRDTLQLIAIPVLLLWKKIPFQVKPKWPAKWATAIKFLLILMFVLDHLVGWGNHNFTWGVMAISGIFEIQVLSVFLPRFVQIYKKEHDTFE